MPHIVIHLMPEMSVLPKLGLNPALLVMYSVILARWLLKIRFGNDLDASPVKVIRHPVRPIGFGRGGDRGVATEPV
jgi:hypothetical protein